MKKNHLTYFIKSTFFIPLLMSGCGAISTSATQSPISITDLIPSNNTSKPDLPSDSNNSNSPNKGAEPLSTQVLKLTNDYRAANGLAPLSLHAQLTSAAQAHAQAMNDLGFFSHTGNDGSSPGDRILEAGYRWKTWGENIAYGYSTADAVMTGWMNSSGHRANILNATFKEIGIGYAGGKSAYWVQDFGAR